MNDIRNLITALDSIQSMISDQDLTVMLEEFAIDEANKWKKARAARDEPEAKAARLSRHSTLAPILDRQPGGRSLLRWLHREMQLGSAADWGVDRANRVSQEKGASKPVTGFKGSGIWGNTITNARVLWEIIKSHPDTFLVFVGHHGVGAVRPQKGYIEARTVEYQKVGKEYNPAKDQALPYHYAFFDKDGNLQKVDHDAFAGAGVDPKAKNISRRGGLPFGNDPNPNLLTIIKGVIGPIKEAFAAYPAAEGETGQSVERGKINQRAAQSGRISIEQQELKTFNTVSPIIKRVVSQILTTAPERSVLKVAIQTKALARTLKERFIEALRTQAQTSGIDLQDTAAYRAFLENAEHSGEELKNTLKLYQSELLFVPE